MTRFCGNPRDAELAGCPMRVTVLSVIGTHAVIAVLHGQVVDPTVGLDMAGEEFNWVWMAFSAIRD